MRKTHDPSFKARVVLEAFKESSTMAELSSKHGVHRVQIQDWKKKAVSELKSIFMKKSDLKKEEDKDKLIEQLYMEIGKQKVEIDWIKKKSETFNGL